MLKILYVVSTLKRSGPTIQLYNLVKHLDRRIFEPYLITLSGEPADTSWGDFLELDVHLQSLNLSRVSGFLLARQRLKVLIEKIRPDLVHSQGIRGDSLLSGLEINFPKVCTIHNFPQIDYKMTYGRLLSALMVRAHIRAMKKFNACIGVSSAVAKNLETLISPIKIYDIPNGVATELFYPIGAKEKLAARKLLNLPSSATLWISSGHLSTRKSPLFLIDAWKRFFSKDSKNHLVFIGDGPLYQACTNAASSMTNIHIVGRVENVASYLQASDYFVSSSTAEGLPNSVLEALACGLPVLLSDISPHTEILKMNTGIGVSYCLNDDASFFEAIEALRVRDRNVCSRNAKRLVQLSLNSEVMSKEYQLVYHDLTGALSEKK